MDKNEKRRDCDRAAVKRYLAKNYTTITVRLRKEKIAAFKAACVESGVSQASVIESAIDQFIAQKEKWAE